jgi:hypothetical protein
MSQTSVLSRAVTVADDLGGDSSPSRVEETSAAFGRVAGALSPSLTSLQSAPGLSAWMSSSSDLVVMHGDFTLGSAPVPPGSPAPQGTVMDVVMDAHTGSVEMLRLGNSEPTAALSQLPAAATLK